MQLPFQNGILTGTAARYEKAIWWCLALALLIAYCTHLGFIPLDIRTDEGRRALVSLEMLLSGDYITPTLNGELFLNKPPLYNWIVIGFVKFFGNFSMFVFRLPVIASLACMGFAVFCYTKKFTSPVIAFFTAFAFCTNGRMLIYDSLQGLIDTSFSLIVYINFMLIFTLGHKKQYWKLFVLTYLLTAAGYMLKGLPMLVFQSLSLLTFFIIVKNVKRLFHPAHFAGIVLLFLTITSYYLVYFSRNDLTPATLFANLVNESTKRTGIVFGLKQTLIHFCTFPFSFLYHFAPWTILVVALFQRQVWQKIRQNSFIHYSVCILLVNIFIYWSSPEVYPRYLFMFLPLFFSIIIYLYFNFCAGKWQQKLIEGIILFVCIALLIVCLAIPFIAVTGNISHRIVKSVCLIALALATLYVAKYRQARLYAFAMMIVIARIGFNWFVIEQRGKRLVQAEHTGQQIAAITAGQNVYLLKEAAGSIGNFDGMSFHISKQRGQILRFNLTADTISFYIADAKRLQGKRHNTYLEFENHLADSTLKLVRFR